MNSVLLILSLALTLLTVALGAFSHHIVLPSGQKIPLRTVQRGLGKEHASHADHRLFEIESDNVLVGKGRKIDVSSAVQRKSIYAPHVIADGVPVKIPPGVLRYGGGFHLIYTSSGDLVSVSGPNTELYPLSPSEYPGVFIDLAKSTNISASPFISGEKEVKVKTGGVDESVSKDGIHSELERSRIGHTSRIDFVRCLRRFDVELAIVTDYLMCRSHSSNLETTALRMIARVQLASVTLEHQTCFRPYVKYLEIHCNSRVDPYEAFRSFPSRNWLSYFSRYWNRERKHVRRDAAIYLTGYSDMNGGPRAGSNFAKMCSRTEGYGWVEHGSHLLLTQTIGHLLGAAHSDLGVMRVPQVPVTNIFTAESVRKMSIFSSTRKSICLRNSRPAQTCEIGFSAPKDMVDCSRTLLYQDLRDDPRIVVGEVYFRQGEGKFSVEVEAKGGAIITDAGIYVSLRDEVNEQEVIYRMEGMRPFQRKKTFNIAWDSIEKFQWETTCCHKNLKIGVKVRYCHGENVCDSRYRLHQKRIDCFDCASRAFASMTRSRCPRCSRRA